MPEIRMLTNQSGSRPDGRDWPQRGYTMEVSEGEYGELIAAGIAAPVATGRGKRSPDSKHDREQREKAATAGDSRDAAAELHARAAETRLAAKTARDEADDLERQAGDQEADAADAQDEADEATRAEDDLMTDDERARRNAAGQPHPVISGTDGNESAGNPGGKSRKGQGQAGQLP